MISSLTFGYINIIKRNAIFSELILPFNNIALFGKIKVAARGGNVKCKVS